MYEDQFYDIAQNRPEQSQKHHQHLRNSQMNSYDKNERHDANFERKRCDISYTTYDIPHAIFGTWTLVRHLRRLPKRPQPRRRTGPDLKNKQNADKNKEEKTVRIST